MSPFILMHFNYKFYGTAFCTFLSSINFLYSYPKKIDLAEPLNNILLYFEKFSTCRSCQNLYENLYENLHENLHFHEFLNSYSVLVL